MKDNSWFSFLVFCKSAVIGFIIASVYLLMAGKVFAQEPSLSDSSKSYDMNEVVIRAERLYNQATMVTQQVKHEEIVQTSAFFVSDVLSLRQGMFIKDYGGLSGIKTISQRGLGTEHSVILLNGMRISSIQNGLMDFSMFPLDEVEQLEILQGGLSSIIGADAVGGAVNLITLQPTPFRSLRFLGVVGSFGAQSFHGTGSTSIGKFAMKASYGTKRERGDFPFTYNDAGVAYNLERKNSDIASQYLALQGAFSPSLNDELRITGYRYLSDRGVAGYVFSPNVESQTRQGDEEHIAQLFYHHFFSNNIFFDVNSQFHHQYNRYDDPTLAMYGIPTSNYFKNTELRFEPGVSFLPDSSISVSVGSEVVRTVAEGNSISSDAERTQVSGYVVAKSSFSIPSGIIQKITFAPSLRYDAFSEDINSFSSGIGAALTFQELSWFPADDAVPSLRLNISKNFRAPTFNELYWNGGGGVGNPTLQPERAINFDAGAGFSYSLLGAHSAKVGYYHISMTDRILWILESYISATPKNVSSVTSEGIEASYQWVNPDSLIMIHGNYTYGTSLKAQEDFPDDPGFNNQLPYIPIEMANLSLSLENKFEEAIFSSVGLTVSFQHVGKRFLSEQNTGSVNGYNLTHVNIRFRSLLHSTIVTTKFEINNLFAQEFIVMPGFPMPSIIYRLSLGLEL